MTVATKTIQFNDLMKVMKKYVGTSEARPVLKLVNFDGKYFTATNSHILIRVNADYVSDIPENVNLYDPKNNSIVNDKMNYPETSRLIPMDSNSTVLLNKDNMKEFHNHIKEVKKVVKKMRNEVMSLEFKRNETLISAENKTEEENREYVAKMNNMFVDGDEVSLHISAKYMDIALESVKKLSKVSNNSIELKIVSRVRPMVFKQDGVFDIIVLPVRTY